MAESGYWTTDDLDALPEDGRRRELIDGVLIVSPSPTNVHQTLVLKLCFHLDQSCPPEYSVTQGVEVRISRTRSFIPDGLVTTAESADRRPNKFQAHEVVLAIEVVSPTSMSFDRVTKPALYAQAGIPHYWRVETEHGITVTTYTLDPTAQVYRETGEFSQVIELAEPWPINLPIADFTPRRGLR